MKTRFLCLLLAAVLVSMLAGCDRSVVTQEPVVIENSFYNAANNMQYNTTLRLFPYNGKLFFWEYSADLPDGSTGNAIFVFEEGETKLIHETDMQVMAGQGRYVYGLNGAQDDIWCMDLPSGEEWMVADVGGRTYYGTYDLLTALHPKDERLLISATDPQTNNYYQLADGKATSVDSPWLTLGERGYYMENDRLMCLYQGQTQDLSHLIPAWRKFLLETDYGILVYMPGIMSGYANELLYLIEPDGTVRNLYTHSTRLCNSSFNIYGEYVYLSVFHHDGEKLRFPWEQDDPKDGTYRIRLTDGSVEKLSSRYYCALFIFDDTGIYACDDADSIYKLDFNGKLTATLRIN